MGSGAIGGEWRIAAYASEVIARPEMEALIGAVLSRVEAIRFTHGRPPLTFEVLGLPGGDEGVFDFAAFTVRLFPLTAVAIAGKLEPEAELPLYVVDLARSAEEYAQLLLTHELGHLVHCVLQSRRDEQAHAWKELWTVCVRNADKWSRHPSAYTIHHRNKKHEYFAEVFALFHHRPDRLRATDLAGFNLVRKAYEICPIPDIGGF